MGKFKDTTDLMEKLEVQKRKSLTLKVVMYCFLEIGLLLMLIMNVGRLTVKGYVSLIIFILIIGYAIYHFGKKRLNMRSSDELKEDIDEAKTESAESADEE